MKGFFRWLKALFHNTMANLEDPDVMLDRARRDMQEALVQKREKAVQSITQKNRLQQMLDQSEAKIAIATAVIILVIVFAFLLGAIAFR